MAENEKKFVTELTDINEDLSQWYTDVITKADLCDYGPVKGTMVIKPYGFEIWEHIKEYLDIEFKKAGSKNEVIGQEHCFSRCHRLCFFHGGGC